MSFREIEKEPLTGQVPPGLATVVRELAGRNRHSLSATITELLCRGLRRSPKEFGVKPIAIRKAKPETVAT